MNFFSFLGVCQLLLQVIKNINITKKTFCTSSDDFSTNLAKKTHFFKFKIKKYILKYFKIKSNKILILKKNKIKIK